MPNCRNRTFIILITCFYPKIGISGSIKVSTHSNTSRWHRISFFNPEQPGIQEEELALGAVLLVVAAYHVPIESAIKLVFADKKYLPVEQSYETSCSAEAGISLSICTL